MGVVTIAAHRRIATIAAQVSSSKMSGTCDLGLIGLAVMGQNIVLNMNDNGYKIAVFNRTVAKVDAFMENEAKGTEVVGTQSIEELCSALKKPRRVMMLVKAGQPVDDFIELTLPFLEEGDIIIDGGNSHFPDSIRRSAYLAEKGFHFLGCGVSGGEEGARHGPSMMPGGSMVAWEACKPIFQAICAKADEGAGVQAPCCDYVGQGGAGHYVKMVHNGIEYGDMQLICEAYFIMKNVLGMSHDEMSSTFKKWNESELDSYLIEISADILAYKDEDGTPLVEKILDRAGQKGTGKWTVISSLETGVPVSLIGESVFARCLSALKGECEMAEGILSGPKPAVIDLSPEAKAEAIEGIRLALYASKIVSYAQGFMLMKEEGKAQGWDLNFGAVALMWRGGCIIRSRFLGNIKEAYTKDPNLSNLLFDDFFTAEVAKCQTGWRKTIALCVENGVPCPAFSTALSIYDGYRCGRLPANLLQAQRDYFGAHTYERIDKPRGEWAHTNWTGTGGTTASSTYNA